MDAERRKEIEAVRFRLSLHSDTLRGLDATGAIDDLLTEIDRLEAELKNYSACEIGKVPHIGLGEK